MPAIAIELMLDVPDDVNRDQFEDHFVGLVRALLALNYSSVRMFGTSSHVLPTPPTGD
jgi:hypothetical protein